MKNPSNFPIKSFARLKKITNLIFKKSVALIVIMPRLPTFCPCRIHAHFHIAPGYPGRTDLAGKTDFLFSR